MEYRTITYKEIRENPEVTALMERGNDMLGALGYTCLLYTSRCV